VADLEAIGLTHSKHLKRAKRSELRKSKKNIEKNPVTKSWRIGGDFTNSWRIATNSRQIEKREPFEKREALDERETFKKGIHDECDYELVHDLENDLGYELGYELA